MRDLKTYLSVAPVVSTLWFGSLAVFLLILSTNHKMLYEHKKKFKKF